ncbi:MAG: hypothetical protein HGA82_00635 [Anaerolineales bacterium]|nr:hypothetical protein [Anaerolineales bacterium]
MSNSNTVTGRTAFVAAVGLCIGVVLTGLTLQAGAGGLPQEIVSATTQSEQPSLTGAGPDPRWAVPGTVAGSPSIFLPLVVASTTRVQLSYRLGVGATYRPLSNYPELPSLRIGWYQDWYATWGPERPNGTEYVYTVRVHQELVCPLWSENAADREKCPYKRPYSYWMYPSMANLPYFALASPGSLWLIGNETDRRDWEIPGGTLGQDEMLPETYAVAYHDIYHAIRAADPTAKVSPGGIIQPTPLRLQYLDMVLDSYRARYGLPMPVDVWNIHGFILNERSCTYFPEDCWGADVPPGINAPEGMRYGIQDNDI